MSYPLSVLLLLLLVHFAVCKWMDWEEFKVTYSKRYSSDAEENYRKTIFRENVKIATALSGMNRTVFGVTKFMDLSRDEFRAKYLNTNSEGLRSLPVLNITPSVPVENQNVKESTLVVDWVSKGATTPIYDQGTCGSCWAFSVTEQHESMRALAGYGLDSLSMQQVLDCATNGGDEGCAGGYPLSAWAYLATVGHELYSNYPYVGEQQSCRYSSQGVPDGAVVKQYGLLTSSEDEQTMYNYLTSTGPISVCVDAETWQYYTGGVIMASDCAQSIDHCVQIVGFVADVDNSGVGVWAVRNSWGTAWGEEGYCYVEAGVNACGIATTPTSCVI